ncbi:MAG TPA: DNA polymerase III subunit gamma/tau [Bacteroidales bacterium]|jgi:DNA polymerase-3 subunit gamma/tau|nr:DNA polymerase III subunit gamma/tau [Bacteroidales bacterium]
MENFIVSARKYRPSTFRTIVGQPSITLTLKNAIRQNQVAQAFLFCGPRGVGKTTCARILAKTINCHNRTDDGEACNQCESCLSFNNSSSFNIFELDAASNNSVDAIRNLVEQVRIPPQGATYKVYIIDEVHMLSTQAFNAFLKTLEEPPAYAKFILATTEKHKIIPTILSRCQIFDFKRIKINDIVSHLTYVAGQENVNFEKEALDVIGQKADGSLRDALSIFDQAVSYSDGNITYQHIIENLNILDYDYFFKIIYNINQEDIAQVLINYNEIIEKGFDGQTFIDGISEHLRNLIACKLKVDHIIETGDNIKTQFIEQAKEMSVPLMLQYLDIFNRCNATYKTTNNKRLHVELALMMACNLKSKQTHVNNSNTTTKTSNPQTNINQSTPSSPHTTTQTFNRLEKTTSPVMKTVQIKDILHNERKANNENKEIEKPLETPPLQTENKTITPSKDEADESEKKIESCSQLQDPLEKLTQNWKSYVEKATPNAIAARMLLNEQKITIKGEDKLFFEVANTIAEKEIKDVMTSLIQIIHTETKIKYQYEILVNQSIRTESKIIDPDEKFKKMLTNNPELLTFKQQLNLSII